MRVAGFAPIPRSSQDCAWDGSRTGPDKTISFPSVSLSIILIFGLGVKPQFPPARDPGEVGAVEYAARSWEGYEFGGERAVEDNGELSDMQDIDPIPPDLYSLVRDLPSLASEGDDDIL